MGESGIIPKDSISFKPDTLDLFTNIEQTILMSIDIPSGLTKGNYVGKVRVDHFGEKKDSMTVVVNINQFPIITMSDTLVSVAVGDTVKVIIKMSDADGDSTNLEAIYPWGGWFENIGGDSLVFCFSPDSLHEGLNLDAVFFATDGKTKTGKSLQIGVFRSIGCLMNDGWNMVSVPLIVTDSRKTVLFPTAVSNAFAYTGNYIIKDTLENGFGYWLKFENAQNIQFVGSPMSEDTIDVIAGWNMIGSISQTISAASIIPIGTSITSHLYGYNNGYFISDSIVPGKSYWIKVSSAGKLVLSSTLLVSGKESMSK